ncbi:MAG: CvpA family protein [Bryobacteraceae bacterium]|nr:CvpA family protein [Bryobacteraceae bacterium]
MNWLDVVLLVLFAVSMVSGAMKGLSRIVLGLVATLLGMVLAVWFYASAGAYFLPYVSSESIANFCGFVTILAGTSLVGSIVSKVVAYFFKAVGLGWLDRLLGAGFGFARAGLLAMGLLVGLVSFAPNPPSKAVLESRAAPYVLEAARLLVAIAPAGISGRFQTSYQEIRARWKRAVSEVS